MSTRHLVLLGLAALPLQALAGTCIYWSDTTAKPDQILCRAAESKAACSAFAAKEASADFVKAHPPRFSASTAPCEDAVKALVTAQKEKTEKPVTKAKAKGKAKPAPKTDG